MSNANRKIWDIRWTGEGFEVYCLLHGEVYKRRATADAAVESAEHLNEQENGPLARTVRGTDILDNPYSISKVWCHGGKSTGHFIAGWYEPTTWVKSNFSFVGERL